MTVDDDDTAGIVIDANPATTNQDESGPIALTEGHATDATKSYTVRLATEPTQTATVTITSDDSAVTVSDSTLTFTSSDWDTAQTVTLTAADDDNAVPESATIAHAAATATTSEYTNVRAALTANTTDNDTAGFVFDADPSTGNVDDAGPLALDELSTSATNSDDYTVRLTAEPTQTVTVTITSANTSSVTVGDTDGIANGIQNTLTFTSSNWNTPQTVTLTAEEDDNGYDETVRIAHRARTTPTSEFNNVSADFEARVDDDETPAIVLSAATLSVPEQRTATYTVRLATEPVGGSATVTITGAANSLSASPTRLVFTARNWSTPRTVTVTAADDDNSSNDQATFRHAATGADYGGAAAAEIVATSVDDDTPSLRVSPTRLAVRENGSGTYLIRLNTQPSATVTVTIGGATAEVTADTDATPGDQTTLTFTAQNWNSNRTVTVSAADDADATDETVNLTHATTGGDYTSLALASRPGVTVEVEDDDTPTILLDADPSTTNADETGPLALNELSGHADNSKNYTVRLATQPTADVEVAVSSGDRAVAVDADATPLTLTLTFTMSNWGTRQTVTARAAEDDDASDETVAISHSATGGDYGGVTAEMVATTVDDDEPAIVVAATTLIGSGVTEGATATYTVRLDTEPAGVARVSVAVEGPVSVDLDRNQSGVQRWLRFDETNWNQPRTAEVLGLQDDDAAGGMATLRHTSSGADYDRAPAVDVAFAVTDNDTPAVLADATAVELNEGSSATYSLRLAAAPTGGPVEVSPASSDDAVATVSPSTLTFDAANWNRPQQVTATGVADGSASVTHSVSGADYGGASTPTVAATVRDTDAAGVRIEPPTLRIREGGSETYRVRLNTQPSGDVLVTPTAAPGSEALAVDADGSPMTFTPQNWSAEQTQRRMAAHDDDAADETLSVLHLVTGYAGVTTAPSLSVVVEDDDAPGIEFAPAGGLSLTEGGAATGTYTAVLTAEPTGDVAVSLSSDDAGLAFDADTGTPGDQTALTFTMANWNTARTLAARAVADADAATEEATLIHSAAGGGYGGVVAAYPVLVSDAEAAQAPSRVEASPAGETSLSVSWSASPGARGYWVQWRAVGGQWSLDRLIEVPAAGSPSGGGRTLRVATGPLSARIDGLLPGQRYEVRVLALNRGDPGDPSRVASATPAAQPSGGGGAPQVANAPTALVLEAGGSAEIDLSDAFRDPDGDALTYAAWSSDEDVVAVRVEASALVVGAGRPGSAQLTLQATDPGGLSAQATVDVDVVGTVCRAEPAAAPEGGVAVATAELSEPAERRITVRWRAVADTDPTTADADAGEHGGASGEGASGEAIFNVGERCAEIEIPILDDGIAEPSREWFALELELRFANAGRLTRQRIPVAVLEGVCDRAPAVREALLSVTSAERCEQPGPAELASVRTLDLSGRDLPSLAAGDLGELSNLRTLNLSDNALSEAPSLSSLPRLERLLLSGNALTEVPSKKLASLSRLRDLDLSNNALEDLRPEALANLPGLRVLRLDGNAIETLPDGLLAGLTELRLLRLDGNPGAPFALPLELERTDAAPWSPSPASLRVSVPSGAPFDLTVALSVEGGTFADGATTATAVVAAGETASARLRVTAERFARVSLSPPPFPPRLCLGQPCWRGFEFAPGEPLALFAREIEVSPPPQPEALFGDALRVPLSSLAMAGEMAGELLWSARSSDPSLATVHVVDGALVVEPAPGEEGVVQVEATATDRHGQTATVRFEVRVEFYWPTSPTRGWRGAVAAPE